MNDVEGNSAQAALRAAGMVAWRWEFAADGVSRRDELAGNTGRAILERIHPQDRERVLAAVQKAFEEFSPLVVEYRILLDGGGIQWVIDRGSWESQTTNETRRLIGVSTEITDRKKREEEWRRGRNEAERIGRAKSEFLARLSHEMRSTVSAVMHSAEQLLDTQLPVRDRMDLVREIIRQGEELGSVIDELTDICKLETERLEIERVPFPLTTILEDVVTSLCEPAQDKRLLLKILPDGRLPEVIVSDPSRLRQILFHVMDNAIKFTERGRVELRVKDVSEPAAERRTLRFTVKDTGAGIRKDKLERLFEPYSIRDRGLIRKSGGSGLGLALSRKLAHALGGDIVLTESKVGVSSTFVITIDAGPRKEAMALLSGGMERNEAAETSGTLRDLRVLLIEDTEDSRNLVHRYLGPTGAAIDFAEDGEEGVERALSESYDLILVNTQMMRMDGFATIRMLRSRDYSKPVIALTANTLQSERERCLAAGFDERILKPFNRGSLVETLRKAANGHHSSSK